MHFLGFLFQVLRHPLLLLLYLQCFDLLFLHHALHLFFDGAFLGLAPTFKGGNCGGVGEEVSEFHLEVEIFMAPDRLIVLNTEGIEFDEFTDGFIGGLIR